jgi:thiol-disulfide isomerase/thioredoxin
MPVREGYKIAAFVALCSASLAAFQPAQVEPEIVAQVRAAMASGGVTEGEKTLAAFRARQRQGPNLETAEALLWLARGALATKLHDSADRYAREGQHLATMALAAGDGHADRAQNAIGNAAELLALVMVDRGARSDAVHFLRTELEAYRGTPAAVPIATSLALLTLEGKPAPSVDGGMTIGPRLKDIKGRPTFLFFWAHWCQECKAESPMLEALVAKYRPHGLTIVAPTRRYGYITAGRPATPHKELQHIARVRDASYRFLRHEPVPVSDANYRAFGVSTIPAHVLIDGSGTVRLYHPGRIKPDELERAIVSVLAR